ncbi:four helix bundle protein [Novipirellula sp.]|uniref:four helix bundle protein n=1 Tax=Novipirellula sp. TaxID=2795430 RepID=UPI003567BFFF
MEERKKTIRKHTDLDVYKFSFASAMRLFELSRKFPLEERYSLTDQCRRSSRSVAANIAEAWRKRRYPAAFVAKLSDSEAEAAETQTWLQFAVECKYVDADVARELYCEYDKIIGMLVNMIKKPDSWRLKPDKKRKPKTTESPNTENE